MHSDKSNPETEHILELKIKNAIRVLSFKDKYEHTVPLFKDHQILPFECQIKHKQAIFMWKLHNGYIPPPISDLFTPNRSEVMLRIHPDRYHLRNPKSEFFKHQITYSCTKLWNNEIPENIRRASLLNHFSKQYKTHLIESSF